MTRKNEFKSSISKPITVSDSRFGIRKLYMTKNEVPSVFSYSEPARSWHGYN